VLAARCRLRGRAHFGRRLAGVHRSRAERRHRRGRPGPAVSLVPRSDGPRPDRTSLPSRCGPRRRPHLPPAPVDQLEQWWGTSRRGKNWTPRTAGPHHGDREGLPGQGSCSCGKPETDGSVRFCGRSKKTGRGSASFTLLPFRSHQSDRTIVMCRSALATLRAPRRSVPDGVRRHRREIASRDSPHRRFPGPVPAANTASQASPPPAAARTRAPVGRSSSSPRIPADRAA